MNKAQTQTIVENNLGITESQLEIMNGINVGIFIQDENTKVIACNDSALELLGITFEQAFGTTAYDPKWRVYTEAGAVFPMDKYPVTLAAQENKVCKDVVMGVHRPNTNDQVWLLVSAVPLTRSVDSTRQLIVTFTDISERVRETKKINSQNKELSEINSMMVDRELKMMELKKELAKLSKTD